jgi:hypothetical protein
MTNNFNRYRKLFSQPRYNQDKSAAKFRRQMAAWAPDNFHLVKSNKIAYNLATTEARNKHRIGIL